VRFVTGHSRDGGLPEDLDWKQVADPSATTIFYMGGKMAGKIAERLTAMGLPLETPVVIASAVSQPEQRIWHCALSDLTSELDPTTSGPVLIGIGRVFGIRQHSNHPAALTEGRRVAESGMTTMKSRGGLALRRY
jgi:uroporphyrin-III C-methyltransferase/precorrin-2 dehydrogenase/sirohydrochlorin ferrochelatase